MGAEGTASEVEKGSGSHKRAVEIEREGVGETG